MGLGGDALGGLGGAIGGAIGLATAGDGGKKWLKKIAEIYEKIQTPDFDMRSLSPPELRLLRQYDPELYTAVLPKEVSLAEDSAPGHQAQLGGINYFEGVRDKGLPVETRLATEEAQRAIQDEQQRGQQSIYEGMQARGRLGGGGEIAARLGGDQNAMELARGMGTDLARNEIQTRMDAASQAAGLGSQERAASIDRNVANSDAINRFNEYLSQIGTQQARDNAMAQERANFGNVENTNRIGETNELNRYNNDVGNLERQNDLRERKFGAEMDRAGGLAGAYGGLATAAYNKRAARVANAQSLGQGVGQTAGAAVDILGGGGFLGSGTQDFYRNQNRRY